MPAEITASESYRQDLVDAGIVIRTEALAKVYQMGTEEVHALCGIDVEIRKGEYVAIMGPSGSGKSTLMNLIGCLDSPSSGRYWLAGRLVSELDDDELAYIRNKEIGFVFQTFNLRQRVAIARALVNNPSIVLADEPTGNLDSKTGEEIMNLFANLHGQGNTIILVTHEMDIAQHAHRVIYIRDGKIASDEKVVKK